MKAWCVCQCVGVSEALSARCVCVCALPLRTVRVELVCTQMKVWAELCDAFVLRLWVYSHDSVPSLSNTHFVPIRCSDNAHTHCARLPCVCGHI